jgi:uncharacterized protein YbbK (DUF523 family)/uncharacterized protein YbgA (DUF1722 family)
MVDAEGAAERIGWEDWNRAGEDDSKLRIGVSACLLGEEVRWDGGHKRSRFLTDELDPHVEWVRVCPEAEAGFGIPRPTMRLADVEGRTRLLIPKTGDDVTERLGAWVAPKVAQLAAAALDGFVVKKDSPSCGWQRVKVYGSSGVKHKDGMGLFTRALVERLPDLPIEEDGRLNDDALRDNFVERIWCRHRWRILRKHDETRAGLVRFHTAHKMLVRAHDEPAYRELGRLVAGFGARPDADVFDDYGVLFQQALARRTTRGKHVNVLQHLLGFLKDDLGRQEKQHLIDRIEDYKSGLVPLVVPLSLLQFEIERRDRSYPKGQLYFDPHPREFKLRNRP